MIQGALDDVRVYNRSLSAAEVAALAQPPLPSFANAVVTPAAPTPGAQLYTWSCAPGFFGPTVAGYRLSAYRRLAEKWSPAPPNLHSDLYMWRKFLSAENMKVGSRFTITSLVLPNFEL